MNATVETLGPCRKLIRIEVDAATVDAAIETSTRDYQREVRFPGFRPGKAPKDLVARTYATEIDQSARKKLISESYRKAVAEHKLEVYGYPEIEEIQFGRGQALQFAATVDMQPDIQLPNYKGLKVQRPSAVVTETDIEKAFAVLREKRATFNDVQRPAAVGDFVVVNYQGTSEGKPLTEFAQTARGLTAQQSFWLEIKEGSFVPGFTEQLVGASNGDKRTVAVTFPEDFVAPALAKRSAVYEVEVLQVKERVLPALDDAFAKVYGAESLEKLREGVTHDLEADRKLQQKRAVRGQLLTALMGQIQCELPQSAVENETRTVVYQIVEENHRRGVNKEEIDRRKDEIYQNARVSAKERVKIAFVLGKIAAKEGISVDNQEMSQRIVHLAQQNNVRPEKLVKRLEENNGFGEIHEQILNNKVVDFLELHAEVEDVRFEASSPNA